MPETAPIKPFKLARWFALISPLAIGLIALLNSWLTANFLDRHLFQREASITRDFVQHLLIDTVSLDDLVVGGNPAHRNQFGESLNRLTALPDVLRANAYGPDRVVLWSSDSGVAGQRFLDNDELEEALRGELVVHSGTVSEHKAEHVGLVPSARYFVEIYVPLIHPVSRKVVAVIEIYKAPVALTQAIEEGRKQAAVIAIISGLVLYIFLFGLIRHADRLIKNQQGKLLDAEKSLAMGELATAVAHNIRNPLSSIRSSAEMILAFPEENNREHAEDIVRESERISSRISELLQLHGQSTLRTEDIDIVQLLSDAIVDQKAAFARRNLALEFHPNQNGIRVHVDRQLLLQVFLSLLSNAAEAMSDGGKCLVTVNKGKTKNVIIEIHDTGSGLKKADLSQIFRPFFTTKPKGLGLGLPLAQRTIARFGGHIEFRSREGVGSIVSVTLPTLD